MFSIKGKIIGKNNEPVKDLKILAYDDDPLLTSDDFLGEATTDSNGFFKIDFDKSKFKNFWEFLEGTPDVYVIVKDNQGKEILNTRVMQTRKEIEYHIKIDDHIADPNAKDIYADNPRRIVGMLGEVGNIIGIENRINLDILRNGNLSREIRERLQNFVNGFEERNNNFEHFMAMLSGLVNTFLEERNLGMIGYDGPQVPRNPRRVAYNQVIVWPRNEEFKWA